jgi:hypothetical protein
VPVQEEHVAKLRERAARNAHLGMLPSGGQAQVLDWALLAKKLGMMQRRLQEMEAEAGGSRAELEAEVSGG